MKKICVIILALLMFTACTKASEAKETNNVGTVKQGNITSSKDTEKNNQINTDDSYFGQYQMSEDGFSQYVKDNPIDRDYKIELDKLQKSSDFTTQSRVELEVKYTEIWDKELNNTYNILLSKLNDNEKEKLRSAQSGWVQFHTKEANFVSESWNDLGLGSQGRVQLVISGQGRIRQRTLQLMEYNYMLGCKVEFLYKGM